MDKEQIEAAARRLCEMNELPHELPHGHQSMAVARMRVRRELARQQVQEAMIDRSASNRSEEPEPFKCKEHTMMVPVSLMISRATKVIEQPTEEQVRDKITPPCDGELYSVEGVIAILKEMNVIGSEE